MNEYKIKKQLLEKGLTKFDINCIIEDITDKLSDIDWEENYEDTIIYDKYQVAFIANDSFDEEEDEYDTEVELDYLQVFDIEELLKTNNIVFEVSNSNSYYFKLNNKDYRIADHKRPAVVDGFASYDWEYENEMICDNEIEKYETIEKLLKAEK